MSERLIDWYDFNPADFQAAIGPGKTVGRQNDPAVRNSGVNAGRPGGHFTIDVALDVISLCADTDMPRLINLK
jgi:hypothetical protein